MKKTIAFVAITLLSVGICRGAAVDWQLSGMNSALKDYLGNTAVNTSVYLILADSTSLATITDTANSSAFEDALEEITVASVSTGADGKKPTNLGSTYTLTAESSLLTAGNSYTFGMLYASEDNEGNGYYRVLVNDATTTAYDPSDPSSSQLVSLSWSNMAKADWKGGYASVPEPSVAIMGLLGLGMLLKRRRA